MAYDDDDDDEKKQRDNITDNLTVTSFWPTTTATEKKISSFFSFRHLAVDLHRRFVCCWPPLRAERERESSTRLAHFVRVAQWKNV